MKEILWAIFLPKSLQYLSIEALLLLLKLEDTVCSSETFVLPLRNVRLIEFRGFVMLRQNRVFPILYLKLD